MMDMKQVGYRKKALMESMKGDADLGAMAKKKELAMLGGAPDGEEGEGFVQMMVSPKEKEMLLKLRAGNEDSDGEDEISLEA